MSPHMPEGKLELRSPDSNAFLPAGQDETPNPKPLAWSCCDGSWENRVLSSLQDWPMLGSRQLQWMGPQANQSSLKEGRATPV